MTASWHVVAKLLTVSRMSKVDYQNKVLPWWLPTQSFNQNIIKQSFDFQHLDLSNTNYLQLKSHIKINSVQSAVFSDNELNKQINWYTPSNQIIDTIDTDAFQFFSEGYYSQNFSQMQCCFYFVNYYRKCFSGLSSQNVSFGDVDCFICLLCNKTLCKCQFPSSLSPC